MLKPCLLRSSLIFVGILLMLPTTAFAERDFAAVYSDVLRGNLARTGNSVMTCDRANETAATCDSVESTTGTPVIHNNNTYTLWIDVDGFVDADIDTFDDTFNSSSGTLTMTAGAVVEWAGLYWNGNDRVNTELTNTAALPQNQVELMLPGSTSYTTITADWCSTEGDRYQCYADVSSVVTADGTFTVANVSANTGEDDYVGGWELTVGYRDEAEPLRSLTVYHGHKRYSDGVDLSLLFDGFVAPLSGPVEATVVLSTNEGDAGAGDVADFQCGTCGSATTLSTDLGNGSISDASGNITTRNPAFRNTLGFDIDVFDVSALMNNGDTEATLSLPDQAGETNEVFKADFAIDIYFPSIVHEKTVLDLNGGDVVPGDTIRYTVTVDNEATSLDDALNLVITDPLPLGVTFVGGSMNLLDSTTGGPATGTLTDAAGDDAGTYDLGTRTLTVNLGDGATSAAGGQLVVGESVSFQFDVTIDNTGVAATIANEAIASYEGATISSGGYVRVNDTPSNDPNASPYGPTDVDVLPDLDGDGLGDTNDLDTDNDGILDIDEGGGIDPSADTDGDLIPDWQDTDTVGFVDANNDTVDDRFDFDFDGIPNHIDLDSDGDGIFDIAETSSATLDANGDGRIDVTTDTDTDGLLNGVDPDNGGTPSVLIDTDGTQNANFLDDDDDGDGITTATEVADGAVHGNNPDNDADPNWYDTDSDGDGIDDDNETDDADIDGTPDYLDDTMILIALPADGGLTSDNLVPVTGQTEAGASITVVFRNSASMVVDTVTTTAGPLGFWSIPPSSALADDTYTIEVDVVDSTNNTASDSVSVTVDTDGGVLTIATPLDASSIQSVTVTGTAEPDATVTVVFNPGPGQVVVTTSASPTGDYSATPPTPLAEGPHIVSVTAVDAALNTAGPESRVFVIDRTDPTIAITTPADGSTGSSSTLSGTTEPGSTVTLVLDAGTVNEQTLTATADINGAWSTTATLIEGPHTLDASAQDAAGNSSPTVSAAFTLDSTPPATLTALLSNGATSGTVSDPTISGTTEAGATVTVVFDAGTANEQTKVVTADGSGNYSATPDTALAEGAHTASVTADDSSGNTAGPVALTFTQDTMAPSVSLDSPGDGDTVGTQPVITGTSEADAAILVTIDAGTANETTISVTADTNGDWSATPNTALAGGAHTIEAQATDAAGNEASTGSITVTVSAATLTLTQPADGDITNDSTPAFVGTADPGATVTLVLDAGTANEQTIQVTANTNGDWFLFSPTLAEGAHTVDVSTDDGLGGTISLSAGFTVDTTAPAVAITAPVDGSSTSNTTPTVVGSTDANLIVDIYMNGTKIGDATANSAGDWTYTFPSALTDGLYEVEARATDAAGNVASDSVLFTIDTVAPTLTIDGPADGATISDNMPDITGTTEPNATVEVTIDGTVAGTATADTSGLWSFTPGAALADGAHTLSGVATDAAGNTSPAASSGFTVDSTLPFIAIASPADGSVTGESTPTLTGTADANASVEISVDGTVVTTVTADANGDWLHTLVDALIEGDHTVTATVDNGQTASASTTFEVDTTSPTLVVDTPMNGVINDNTPTVSGTTDPNATVDITLPDGSMGTIVADGNGDWSFVTPNPQPEGDGQITVVATDPAGNTTTVVVDITIDVTAPNVAITNPDDNATTNDVNIEYRGTADADQDVELFLDGTLLTTVTTDASGDWSYTDSAALADGVHTLEARATDNAGNLASDQVDFIIDSRSPDLKITAPTEGDIYEPGDFSITGTTEPNQVVSVFVDGTKVADVTADANGDWNHNVSGVAAGDHVIRAEADDGNGNISNDEVNVTIEFPTAPLVIVSPTDGEILTGGAPTFSGTAEPGTTVEIFLNDVSLGSALTDANGNWEFTADGEFPDGVHTLKVTDDLGGEETRVFVIDTDDSGEFTVTHPTEGDSTNDTNPTVSGTGSPGDTIEVFVDGVKVGEATVAPDGTWELVLIDDLEEGPHTLEVTVTRIDGTTETIEVTFEVDLTPPTGEIVRPDDGETTSSQPPIEGTSEPGTIVEVYIDGQKSGETAADGDGHWTFTPAQPLDDGDHVVTVVLRDDAGNETELGPVSFTSDGEGSKPGDGLVLVGGQASCSSAQATPTMPSALVLLLVGLFGLRRRR